MYNYILEYNLYSVYTADLISDLDKMVMEEELTNGKGSDEEELADQADG